MENMQSFNPENKIEEEEDSFTIAEQQAENFA